MCVYAKINNTNNKNKLFIKAQTNIWSRLVNEFGQWASVIN